MNGYNSEVINMHNTVSKTHQGNWASGPILVQVVRPTGYGSVPGLEDEELADPEELERQVILEMWGPILALPERRCRTGLRPVIDEFGHLDWGAFGTVDFLRLMPSFDRVAYKEEKLREQLRHTLIRLSVIRERVSGAASCRVLKYLDMGVVDFDDIVDSDMQAIARLHLRVRRLQREIRELQGARRQRQAEPRAS
jgi:hypothetical protein